MLCPGKGQKIHTGYKARHDVKRHNERDGPAPDVNGLWLPLLKMPNTACNHTEILIGFQARTSMIQFVFLEAPLQGRCGGSLEAIFIVTAKDKEGGK